MNYHSSIPQSVGDNNEMLKDRLTPKAIVAALDEHIVGQDDAKRAVAVALRNRWRRQQLSPELRDEVTPKNILMIGPTGCGKTEISRRLAKLADAPFVKVEATKFTEVGYVGRDVEQIARDLVEEAVRLERDRRRAKVRAGAEEAAMDRLLDALTGKGSSEATRQSFRQRFADGSLDKAEVEIEVDEAPAMPFEIPGMGAQVFDLKSVMGKAFGQAPRKRRKLKVPEAFARLTEEEADKRIDPDDINRVALADAEANGIVFLDEIDKIAVSDVRGGSVSREGVQRDLLPLIEGTTVATKYGPLKTDHILFIASGAFHIAKPADLLPELQGRLPIRVELKALTQQDFVRILSSTRASLTEQYQALLGTEDVTDRVHRGRHRGARPHRRRGQRSAREYRRAAAADGDGETARGGQLRRRGPARRDARRRRRLRRCPAVEHRPQRRPQPLRALTGSPVAPHQPLHERRPQARLDTGEPQAARRPIVAGGERARLAGGAVESVAAAVAGMGDALRAAVEVGADRGPQAAIFLGPQPDLAHCIGRARHIFDVHDAPAAGQRRPDRPRLDVAPARRVEIDALLARSEGDPAALGSAAAKSRLGNKGAQSSPCALTGMTMSAWMPLSAR